MAKSNLNKRKKELQEMSAIDLKNQIKDYEKQLFIYEMQHSSDELKQTHKIKETKKWIARAKTYLNSLN